MSDRYPVDTSIWPEASRPGGQRVAVLWLRETLLRDAVVLAPPVKAS